LTNEGLALTEFFIVGPIVDQIKEVPMTLQINVAPDFRVDTTEAALGIQTRKSNRPRHLVQIMARTTACSPMVFAGLVAWASRNDLVDNHHPWQNV